MILANEEALLYERLKSAYNDVTNAGHVYNEAFIRESIDQYLSFKGWIGRHAALFIPAVIVVSAFVGFAICDLMH